MTLNSYFVKNPRQAATLFSQPGQLPKHKSSFLVRFNRTTPSGSTAPAMTFTVKSIDRPQIQPQIEELHQYGKKRQVYTGVKYSPVKCTLYDTDDNAVQAMWLEYSRYYFGEFAANSTGSYSYDATGPQFLDTNGTGFGFTASNGGQTVANAQFFFSSIDILHFRNGKYDLYSLINPRIASYDPDDLDYEQSGISMVTMSFAYEALQFTPNAGVATGVIELSALEARNFAGQVIDTDSSLLPGPSPVFNTIPYNPPSSSTALIDSLLSSIGGSSTANVANYRYNSSQSGGGLGVFGNFAFGASGAGSLASLATAALSNPSLTAALGFGQTQSPISASQSAAGISPALLKASQDGRAALQARLDQSNQTDQATAATPFDIALQQGAVGSAAIAPNTPAVQNTNSGTTLSASAYGIMNASGNGTAQVGFNAPDAIATDYVETSSTVASV